jgi:putative inorganic carbon (HCO3(-)) transporter
MRSYFIALLVAAMTFGTFAYPIVGVYGWTWISLLAPHKQAWGPLTELPLNLIIACVTFVSWMLSNEPKRLPMNSLIGILLLFMAWTTVTTAFSLWPTAAWPHWSQDIKIMLLGLVVAGLINNQVRIHTMIWVIALCLGFFAVKGGGFTLLTGGSGAVVSSTDSTLGDNNGLALALICTVPMMNYLRLQSERHIIRLGLGVAMFLTVIAVIGTYSRGGLIGLLVMGGYFWLQSKQKVFFALFAVVVVVVGIKVMPQEWTDRMNSISTAADDDQSFQGRIQSWHFAMNVALARPLVGAGFNATENGYLFRTYLNDPTIEKGRAAHSIYFQVLGDHGFVGLAIYLALWAAAWRQIRVIKHRARGDPQMAWAYELTTMLQVSLVSYMVAGAALSMAYYDMLYIIFGVLVSVREIVTAGESVNPARARMARPLIGVPARRF